MIERQYIEFKLVGRKSKTNVWAVMNITHQYPLGVIKWYPSWRQYCFFTEEDDDLILSTGCMEQLTEFTRRMNKQQKDGKHGK